MNGLPFSWVVNRKLFLPCYSSKWESQPCGAVWGQDKLCRIQGQGCVYYIGDTPNAKVSCPFLVCSAWEGREGILMPGAVVVELAFAFVISSFLPADTQRWSRDASGRFALHPFCVLSSPLGCPLLCMHEDMQGESGWAWLSQLMVKAHHLYLWIKTDSLTQTNWPSIFFFS